MKHLFAVAALAVFVLGCSDATIPDSLRQPHVVSKAGIPPPPPLPGGGNGFVDAGESDDIGLLVVADIPTSQQCDLAHNFNGLSYSLTLLQNDPDNNTVVHLTLTGSTTGTIDLHATSGGASDIHGQIEDQLFSFTIQGGTGTIGPNHFDFTLNGILRDKTTGEKCKVTGSASGSIIFGE